MGVSCVDENDLSHHFLEDVALHREPAEKSERTGRGRRMLRLATSHKEDEGCHLTSGDSLLPGTLKGPPSSILL